MVSERRFSYFRRVNDNSNFQKTGYFDYVVGRRFYILDLKTVEPPVNETLPKFRGKDAATWLDRMVDEPSDVVCVLDIGCGSGQAMADIKDRHGDKVEVCGLTRQRFYPSMVSDSLIVEGDVKRLPNLFPRGRFGLIYSHQCFEHVWRPVFQAAQKVYPLLKKEGIAFLDIGGGQGSLVDGLESDFIPWFKKMGYEIDMVADREELYGNNLSRVKGVSLRKPTTRPKLLIPSTYRFKGSNIVACFDAQKARAYESELLSS